MKGTLFFIVIFMASLGLSWGQVSLTNGTPTATIDFSSSMQSSVGYGTFLGNGFSPTSIPGRLNSNAWETHGWSNGDLVFGAALGNPAHARGAATTAVISEGIYAYTDAPATAANPTLMMQPVDGDFMPGSLTLKIRNNGTTNITQLSVSYNLFIRNDENKSNSFNFSHSPDNVVFESEPALDYASPELADAFQWISVDVAPSRSTIITGLNIPPNGVYYIRWTSDYVSGTGEYDEIGLDDIQLSAFYGTPAPEINVKGNGYTIVSGDMTPTTQDATLIVPTYTGGSFSTTTFDIQNIGGAILNITNVTITGVNPGDFQFFGTVPNGPIAAADGTFSYKQLFIKFTPGAVGVRSAIVSIYNTDTTGAENPYTFKIQSNGLTPVPDIQVVANTAPYTAEILTGDLIPDLTTNTLFASQVVGGPGETKGYRIYNRGTPASQLLLTDPSPYITISGANPADFTLVTFPATNNIVPNFFKSFSIKFSPTAAGIRTAIITIVNNDLVPDINGNAEDHFTFLVQGSGVAAEIDITGNSQPVVSGSVSTTALNHTFFDYVNVTSATLDRTYTIQNTGNTPLTIGALSVTGSTDFTVLTTPAASLAVNATTTFTIRFNPSSVGLKTANVSLVNSDFNENPYLFAVSGYGVDYTPCAFLPIEVIAMQNFEAAPSPPWAYTTTGTTSISGGTAFGAVADSGSSQKFINANSFQVIGNTGSLLLAPVNTLQFSDTELNIRLSSLGVTASTGNDLTDKVTVAVSIDGGTTWSNEVEVTGNTDSKWSFLTGSSVATATYDGNNIQANFSAGSGGFLTSSGFGTISLNGLPKVAALRVRISMNNNANEIWAIDDIVLRGRREAFTTWNGSWSNGTPTISMKAIINGPYSTSANGAFIACKCQINSGSTLNIGSGTTVAIESDLDNSGTIVIEDQGSLVQKNDFAVNTGTITVKRFTTPMTKFDYTYWSSPVVGQTLFNLSPLTLSDKYFQYNPISSSWQNIPSSTVMLPGKGYIVRAPQTFSVTVPQQYVNGQFVGVPNNGIIQTPVNIGTGTWNLIGNPYPSAIDANLFLANPLNTGTVGGTIYLWTHNTPITSNTYTSNDYAAYNLSGGIGTKAANLGVNNSIPTGKIASGQGFFIAATQNGQATFSNNMRISGNNMQFFRSEGVLEESLEPVLERHRVWLNITNDEGAFKQTLVGYIAGATNDMDRDYDGALLGSGNSVSIYSLLGSEILAIQGRALPFDNSDLVSIGYNSTAEGEFTISIEQVDGLMEEQDIFLVDKLLDIVQNLKQAAYTFSTAAGTFNDRFELKFVDQVLGNNDLQIIANDIQVATDNGSINIRSAKENIAEVLVYDMLGRKVFNSKTLSTLTFSADNISSAQQSLIVKVILESGKFITRKIIL